MLINHCKKQYIRKKPKTNTYRDFEKKLDRVFSEYIRLSKSNDGYCTCVTCGNIHHWKEIHNGHFISRSVKATRFNEINCNPQCVRCNSFRQGEHHIYRKYLINKYGEKTIEDLENTAHLGGSYSAYDLENMISEYKEKVRKLKIEVDNGN